MTVTVTVEGGTVTVDGGIVTVDGDTDDWAASTVCSTVTVVVTVAGDAVPRVVSVHPPTIGTSITATTAAARRMGQVHHVCRVADPKPGDGVVTLQTFPI